MKKSLYLVLFEVVFVSGCMSADGPSFEQLRSENRQNLMKLSIGMTKQEVMTIMGDKTGYIKNYLGRRDAEWPTASNPYRSAILQGKEKTFEVLYYYTETKKTLYNTWGQYQGIADDELTPLVFDEDKLIGWGREFLEQNIQKYEIRLR